MARALMCKQRCPRKGKTRPGRDARSYTQQALDLLWCDLARRIHRRGGGCLATDRADRRSPPACPQQLRAEASKQSKSARLVREAAKGQGPHPEPLHALRLAAAG